MSGIWPVLCHKTGLFSGRNVTSTALLTVFRSNRRNGTRKCRKVQGSSAFKNRACSPGILTRFQFFCQKHINAFSRSLFSKCKSVREHRAQRPDSSGKCRMFRMPFLPSSHARSCPFTMDFPHNTGNAGCVL